jgi:hypothetical protein
MAPAGQTCAHIPQPAHLSAITEASKDDRLACRSRDVLSTGNT